LNIGCALRDRFANGSSRWPSWRGTRRLPVPLARSATHCSEKRSKQSAQPRSKPGSHHQEHCPRNDVGPLEGEFTDVDVTCRGTGGNLLCLPMHTNPFAVTFDDRRPLVQKRRHLLPFSGYLS